MLLRVSCLLGLPSSSSLAPHWAVKAEDENSEAAWRTLEEVVNAEETPMSGDAKNIRYVRANSRCVRPNAGWLPLNKSASQGQCRACLLSSDSLRVRIDPRVQESPDTVLVPYAKPVSLAATVGDAGTLFCNTSV